MSGAQQTPRRGLRPRGNTPLPAVQPRASTAYGSQGKAALGTRVTTTATNLSQAFEDSRARATSAEPARTRETRSHSALRASIPREAAVHAGNEATAAASAPPATPDALGDSRPGTALHGSAVYGTEGVINASTANQVERHEPQQIVVFFHTILRYISGLLLSAWTFMEQITPAFYKSIIAISFLCVFVTALYWMPLSEGKLGHYRNNFSRHFKSPPGNPTLELSRRELTDQWMRVTYDRLMSEAVPDWDAKNTQHNYNVYMLVQMEDLQEQFQQFRADIQDIKAEMNGLKSEQHMHADTLNTLRNLLPAQLAIQAGADGSWTIQPVFWDALVDRLTNGETSNLWSAFLSANVQTLKELVNAQVQATIDDQYDNNYIVSANTFTQLMDEKFVTLSSHHQKLFQDMERQNLNAMKTIATDSINEVLDTKRITPHTQSQLETLVKAHQVQVAYDKLNSRNFFAAELGARVDSWLTSPTKHKPVQNWLQWIWSTAVASAIQPPITALQDWSGVSGCWCASPTNGMGRAQLTIRTADEIFPDTLVIEHIPAAGAVNIAAAPKELEIWAELPSRKEAARMAALMRESVPYLEEYKCGKPPSPKFVCIGQAFYNIHSETYVQKYSVWAEPPLDKLSTKKFAVRVTENWGADYTCLYRVRMTGKRVKDAVPTEGDVTHQS